ncbi:MAG: helix-turn-helix transcriptional regulator [Eggerthellaceae bacterium]|nr:helix-turn-helix transcriptional regulator [Eggerthellaceae bacterium]
MEHHQQIVKALETARDERGIPKSELARRAEVDPRRLMLILEGKRQMRADEFVRVCLVMAMPITAFAAEEACEPPSSKKDARL